MLPAGALLFYCTGARVLHLRLPLLANEGGIYESRAKRVPGSHPPAYLNGAPERQPLHISEL